MPFNNPGTLKLARKIAAKSVPVSAGTVLSTYSISANSGPIAVDSQNNVWVLHKDSDSITHLSSTGSLLGTYATGSQSDQYIPSAGAIKVDPYDNVWVLNVGVDTVTKRSSTGSIIGTYGTYGADYDMTISSDGSVWMMALTANDIMKLNNDGTQDAIGFAAGLSFGTLAIDNDGNVWSAALDANTVNKLSGVDLTTIGPLADTGMGVSGLCGHLVSDNLGAVWILNAATANSVKLSSTGSLLATFETGITSADKACIVIAGGNTPWITTGNSLLKISSTGAILGTFLSGRDIQGVALAPDGCIWVTDRTNNKLLRLQGVEC